VTTIVCELADVPPGEGRVVTIDGRRIAVFHAPSGWYALDAVCPHRGGPLADGIVSDTTVTCPLHDRRFDLATGASLDGCDAVAAYPVTVEGDRVYLATSG
jgi:nitrite reductase (NADH) small subunit